MLARTTLPSEATVSEEALASEAIVPKTLPPSEVSTTLRRPCQYIEGEKGRDYTLYADAPRCTAAAQPGSSYCPAHNARCRAQRQPSEAA